MTCNNPINVLGSQRSVYVGVWGEDNARSVIFDISPWQAAYGNGTLQIIVNRPGETLETGEPLIYEASNVAVSTDGQATWTFDDVDTAIPGNGSCALIYRVGDNIVAKTKPFRTYIADTLGHSGAVVPPALESWYNDILQASADAQEAAEQAAEAASHYPIIGPNKNWWLWDVTAGEYVDSGVSAEGKGGSDAFFTYEQMTPAASWTIIHNLNKYPAVSITDSAGTIVTGDVQYIDENSLIITFQSAFAGKAYLN